MNLRYYHCSSDSVNLRFLCRHFSGGYSFLFLGDRCHVSDTLLTHTKGVPCPIRQQQTSPRALA
jgi:hypothetical protein